MTKQEIAWALSIRTKIEYKEALGMVDSVLAVIFSALSKGENVSVRNFGSFKLVNRKAHRGYDFVNKKNIDLPARTEVKFYPSEKLANSVKQ